MYTGQVLPAAPPQSLSCASDSTISITPDANTYSNPNIDASDCKTHPPPAAAAATACGKTIVSTMGCDTGGIKAAASSPAGAVTGTNTTSVDMLASEWLLSLAAGPVHQHPPQKSPRTSTLGSPSGVRAAASSGIGSTSYKATSGAPRPLSSPTAQTKCSRFPFSPSGVHGPRSSAFPSTVPSLCSTSPISSSTSLPQASTTMDVGVENEPLKSLRALGAANAASQPSSDGQTTRVRRTRKTRTSPDRIAFPSPGTLPASPRSNPGPGLPLARPSLPSDPIDQTDAYGATTTSRVAPAVGRSHGGLSPVPVQEKELQLLQSLQGQRPGCGGGEGGRVTPLQSVGLVRPIQPLKSQPSPTSPPGTKSPRPSASTLASGGASRSLKSVSLVELRRYFDRPIEDAARAIGICSTLLKKICRRYHIKRWPYRQVKSLDRTLECLKLAMTTARASAGQPGHDPKEEARLCQQIRLLEARKVELIESSTTLGSVQIAVEGEDLTEGKGRRTEGGTEDGRSFQLPSPAFLAWSEGPSPPHAPLSAPSPIAPWTPVGATTTGGHKRKCSDGAGDGEGSRHRDATPDESTDDTNDVNNKSSGGFGHGVARAPSTTSMLHLMSINSPTFEKPASPALSVPSSVPPSFPSSIPPSFPSSFTTGPPCGYTGASGAISAPLQDSLPPSMPFHVFLPQATAVQQVSTHLHQGDAAAAAPAPPAAAVASLGAAAGMTTCGIGTSFAPPSFPSSFPPSLNPSCFYPIPNLYGGFNEGFPASAAVTEGGTQGGDKAGLSMDTLRAAYIQHMALARAQMRNMYPSPLPYVPSSQATSSGTAGGLGGQAPFLHEQQTFQLQQQQQLYQQQYYMLWLQQQRQVPMPMPAFAFPQTLTTDLTRPKTDTAAIAKGEPGSTSAQCGTAGKTESGKEGFEEKAKAATDPVPAHQARAPPNTIAAAGKGLGSPCTPQGEGGSNLGRSTTVHTSPQPEDDKEREQEEGERLVSKAKLDACPCPTDLGWKESGSAGKGVGEGVTDSAALPSQRQ